MQTIEELKNILKPGNIIYCEYFDCGGASWIGEVKYYRQLCIDEFDKIDVFIEYNKTIMITTNNNDKLFSIEYNSTSNATLDVIRLATLEERQYLIDKKQETFVSLLSDLQNFYNKAQVYESIGIDIIDEPSGIGLLVESIYYKIFPILFSESKCDILYDFIYSSIPFKDRTMEDFNKLYLELYEAEYQY